MYHTRLQVICDLEFSEILMTEIAEVGFDTFMETDNGFEAFAEGDSFDVPLLEEVKNKYAHVNPLLFYQDKIQKKNWNEEWEKNLEPIIVEDKCLVRAEFHKIEKKYPYEIIITPKMSFGTGHHQTTYLMLKAQMQIDHKSKRVMDAGCGTAILSIMASKLGAKEVEAFDIDEWSVINGKENIENNQCTNIHLQQGKISELSWNGKFELILANINKNILLAEMKEYSAYLERGGLLLLSGFYSNDIVDLEKVAEQHNLQIKKTDEKELWATLLLEKIL
jgi:ribosomal protein L11 methyltransferase